MKLEVHAPLVSECVKFLRRKIIGFDTSDLEYFRLYDRAGKTSTTGVWGRCTYPNTKKQLGYRIRCSVAINPSRFPYRVKWAVGSRPLDCGDWDWIWREDSFNTREEAFVWIAGHEAFHWLRHSRQIPGRNVETQANRYGFAWLDEWRALWQATALQGMTSSQGCEVSIEPLNPKEDKAAPTAEFSKVDPNRTLKIEEEGDFFRGRIKPKIRLMGRWLERAGFKAGTRVSVICLAHGIIELRSDAFMMKEEK